MEQVPGNDFNHKLQAKMPMDHSARAQHLRPDRVSQDSQIPLTPLAHNQTITLNLTDFRPKIGLKDLPPAKDEKEDNKIRNKDKLKIDDDLNDDLFNPNHSTGIPNQPGPSGREGPDSKRKEIRRRLKSIQKKHEVIREEISQRCIKDYTRQ